MKSARLIHFFAMLVFILLYQPTFVFGDAVFFDADGNAIDKAQYQAKASNRDKSLSMKLENGYTTGSNVWKDPIKLRKTRIEQWRIMRSHYDPDSLPSKIEKASPYKN
jgi:hypothetical protein